jgi:hypothetical protein
MVPNATSQRICVASVSGRVLLQKPFWGYSALKKFVMWQQETEQA